MHLYLREAPRTIYLVTSSQEEAAGRPPRALVIRTAENDSSRAVVELLHKDDVELSAVVRLTGRIVKGCLGLVSLGEHMFLAVVTSATDLGDIRPTAKTPEVAARIHQVAFFCLTSNAWDTLANESDLLSRDIADPLGAASSTSGGVTANAAPVLEHPCVPLSKMLSSGTFYYAVASTRSSSSAWDISTRMAVRQMRDRAGHDVALFDDRFVWNNYIARGLLDFRERLDPRERTDFDLCQFLVLVIQGFVGTFDLPLPAPPTHGKPVVATLSLVSRLGYKRAGTRFNTRGVDDDGNTANFVEVRMDYEYSVLGSHAADCARRRFSFARISIPSAMYKFAVVCPVCTSTKNIMFIHVHRLPPFVQCSGSSRACRRSDRRYNSHAHKHHNLLLSVILRSSRTSIRASRPSICLVPRIMRQR